MKIVLQKKQKAGLQMKSQQGLGLATALFVITVMALLAVLINQLVFNNAQSTAEEINLIRAFYAAESGVQYGLNQAFPPDGSATACPVVTNTSAAFTPPTIDADGLNQCTMEVSCATLVVSSATYYTVTGKGTCGDVSRTIQVRAQ